MDEYDLIQPDWLIRTYTNTLPGVAPPILGHPGDLLLSGHQPGIGHLAPTPQPLP